MGLNRDSLMLGVTGSFGSGCTTLAEALAGFGYKRVSLSAAVRDHFAELHSQTLPSGELSSPTKSQLQDIGNELRRKEGPDVLARRAVSTADALPEDSLVVFDGIRNAAEVDYLRHTFPNFVLFSVWSPQTLRWERVREEYRGNQAQFIEDDKRDGNEDLDCGQQVQLCVDKADIVIRNDGSNVPAPVVHLKRKVEQYINLLRHTEVRPPSHDEVAMSIAYMSSLRSQCLKRTAGAAITEPGGVVISTGYNENPEPVPPCVRKFGYCYKDAILKEHIKSMLVKWKSCPYCPAQLAGLDSLGEGYKCPECKKSLVGAYMPDRGMSRCTAIHAEQMAIINAGRKDLKGTILYTTTFPCSQCAHQIVYAGITGMVYIEPYPDPDSQTYLKEFAGITVSMFEGVKARAYERIFGAVRGLNEKKYSLLKLGGPHANVS